MEALMIGVSGTRGTIGGTLTPAVVSNMASALAVWLKQTQKPINGTHFVVGNADEFKVLLGAFLEMMLIVANLGTALVLFPVLKRESEPLALGYVAARTMESVFIAIGIVSLLSVVTLRQHLASTTGAGDAAFVPVGQSLVAVRNWTFLLGPNLMAALNALLLGTLMYRSRLVPRVIPTVGLVGAVLLLADVTAIFFGGYGLGTVWHGIASAPIFAWELSLGVWMAVKGFRPSAITTRFVPTA